MADGNISLFLFRYTCTCICNTYIVAIPTIFDHLQYMQKQKEKRSGSFYHVNDINVYLGRLTGEGL